MTDLERWIERINNTRGLSQAQKQRLRQRARAIATASGEMGPERRREMQGFFDQEVNAGGNNADPDPNPNPNPNPVDPNPNPNPNPVDPNPTPTPVDPNPNPNPNPSPTDPGPNPSPTDPSPTPTDPGTTPTTPTDPGTTPTTPTDPVGTTPTQPTTPIDTGPSPAEISAIRRIITSMGLDGLWNGVYSLLVQGYTDADQILFMLSSDSTAEGQAYQEAFFRRFPAIRLQREENIRRINQGLPPIPELSPIQYVAQERAYLAAVAGFDRSLATMDNITAWISGNVSPQEVQGRLGVAQNYVLSQVNPGVKDELRSIYGLTDQDMVRYVLSDAKTQAQLESEWQSNMRRANVGAAARSQGIGITSDMRDQIAMNDQGYSFGSTAQQFSNVAAQAADYGRLAAISRIDVSPITDLVAEQFGLSGGNETTKKKRRLASEERGRFSGMSAIGRYSLQSGGLGSQ